MAIRILPSLTAKLANAHQLLETLVLRTNEGAVFTIEIGESRLTEESSPFGAKVTLHTNPPTHIGVCQGDTIEQVGTAAQELISRAIAMDIPSRSVVPKPHMPLETKVPV